MARILLCLLMLALATPALASDGVLEINQTCAVETGCFPGDAPGYPVTIDGSAGGSSYRLTSDLVGPFLFTTGIEITTNDVGVDLNNFAIVRSGCKGAAISCGPELSTGYGVRRGSDPEIRGLSVRNGSVLGMGASGVLLGPQAEAVNLRVRWNGYNGISTGEGSTVSGNTAHQNGADGINADTGSTVSGNTAYQNGTSGIDAGTGSTVSGNTAYLNGVDGIIAGEGSTVTSNSARANDAMGIRALTGSTVSNNTTRVNDDDGISAGEGTTVTGNSSSENGDDGIAVGAGSLVERNTVRANGTTSVNGTGLNLIGDAAYRGNVATGNTNAQVVGGVNLGENHCSGPGTTSATCP